ncbi:MAG: phosphopantetheine-binding protein [Rhodobacteraceae bacterium]|nr:MAG: phosphopantetheine-binding protein [Paracoccaceae bacterium]|tara:strand:+ start:472 stop:750 length:279 start_codon:yes stop_codon:yes gene_type:complete
MARNVKKAIINILAEQALLSPKDISENSSLDSMGIDSLGLVEIIFSIEEAFNITIPFNANDPKNNSFDISSVESIVKAVEQIIDKSAKRNKV